MKRTLTALIAAALTCAAAAESMNPDLARQARAATEKGVAWLKSQQKENGAWSEENMPALTALPLWALAASGLPDTADAQKKATANILAKQQPDGGFYVMQERQGGGLGNYNTSVCVTALHAAGRQDLAPAILKARAYIASSQLTGETQQHAGGFGYDKSAPRPYTDLNNTHFALDAMRRTQSVEDLRPAGEARVDVNWDAALKYVEQLQSKDGDTQGGFAYNREPPRDGTGIAADGTVMLRAYGSMTYAGVLSLIHANLDKGDPRVRAAFAYASRHWTVDENPGQGQQGLFFYFNIMSRALTAAGTDTLHGGAGDIRWREELAKKVISLQKPDGSWANDNNRWWENDPVLATAYAILALQFATGAAK